MSDADTKSATGRSPAYPFIPLEKALSRAEELRKAVGRNETRVESAKHHWKYGPKSSGGIQTVAALRHFDLIEDTGSGADKRIKLSDLALRILLDQRPDSSERRQLIQKAALAPKMHQELWTKWRNEPPVDAEIRHYLILDRKFNENGADDLIAEYKATISYAGLLDSSTIPSEEPDIFSQESGSTGGQMEPAHNSGHKEPKTPAFAGGAGAGGREMKDDFSVLLQGNRLKINATVDADGINRLKQVLEKYEEILKLLQ
jgi:hypothetical protein